VVLALSLVSCWLEVILVMCDHTVVVSRQFVQVTTPLWLCLTICFTSLCPLFLPFEAIILLANEV
jgi:hypothetical protein